MNERDLSNCFGCGGNNPIGLHLKNIYIGDKAHIEFKVAAEYCGHPGILHGGITCILFDEVMFYAIFKLGINVVTTNMEVDYESPALQDSILVCEAFIDKREGKNINVVATIVDKDTNKLIATSKGTYIEIDLDKFIKKASIS